MSGAHLQRAHVEYSPSSAYRWMACPGSIQLCRKVPPQPTSVYAAEGTSAHELAEYCFANGLEPRSFLGQTWDIIPALDAEFVDAVQVYTDHVRALNAKAQWSAVERWFYLDPLDPPAKMSGTCDHCCLIGSTLHVNDYKHGKGVAVEVAGNKQLRYYALGALVSLPEEWGGKVNTVIITVIQPRAYHPDGPIRIEEVPVFDLLDFAFDAFDAVLACEAPNAPLVPGDHCRFCAAQGVCPELKKSVVKVTGQEFFNPGPVVPPSPDHLTHEQLGSLMARFQLVEDWMAAVRQYAFHALSKGVAIPGWKLVPKRATRHWKDEKEVRAWARRQKLTKDQILEPPALRSPAQMEKAIGKDRVPPELIQAVSSGLTLAEESDPRPAAPVITAAEEFSVIPN